MPFSPNTKNPIQVLSFLLHSLSTCISHHYSFTVQQLREVEGCILKSTGRLSSQFWIHVPGSSPTQGSSDQYWHLNWNLNFSVKLREVSIVHIRWVFVCFSAACKLTILASRFLDTSITLLKIPSSKPCFKAWWCLQHCPTEHLLRWLNHLSCFDWRFPLNFQAETHAHTGKYQPQVSLSKL